MALPAETTRARPANEREASQDDLRWEAVCQLDDIVPNTGVCALVGGQQVAVVRVTSSERDDVFAISNFDPFSEAFVLGERLGLSHQALFDVASNASGQCWALTTNCPVPGPVPASPANRGYQPGFSGALMAKDLGLAEHALDDTGVRAELGRLAASVYRRFAGGDGAALDFSAIIDDIREHSESEAA